MLPPAPAVILHEPMPPVAAVPSGLLPGFHQSPWFGEQTCEEWIEPGVRVVLNAPALLDPARPTRLILYATPNGNTIEQTLGSTIADVGIDGGKTDWHYDIQHIAAQVRMLRSEVSPGENIVLACVEAEGLSWPLWRQKHPDNAFLIRKVVDTLREQVPATPANPVRVMLAGHSGGGSFLFGFLNAAAVIPPGIERIAFLDANYAYSDTAERHGDKLLAWLHGDESRRLFVLAYDDREISLNGKKVLGAEGGTFRATERMIARFAKDGPLTVAQTGWFVTHTGLNGRAVFHVHPNPENKILHTALVGEMNGLLEAGGAPAASWGTFGTASRAYSRWIQPATALPPRRADAVGGASFIVRIASLSPAAREEAIATEICRGNFPEFLRRWAEVTVRTTDTHGTKHTATYQVMPDYLAVGSDADFVRLPMTPQTAQRIADAWGCSLPTRKMVDDVYRLAAVNIAPHPLTDAREAVATFARHNALIEEARISQPPGALTAGIKKDVVVTNRLNEKPNRVAIYGWHKPDGSPIQPLTIVHRETYTDYSHGIRLVRRDILVDGRKRDLHAVLHDPDLCGLLSDEGPLLRPSY